MKKKFKVDRSSTSFILDHFRTFATTETADRFRCFVIDMMCDGGIGVLVRQMINSQEVFSFRKDYEYQCTIVDYYDTICVRTQEMGRLTLRRGYKPDMALSSKQRRVMNAVAVYGLVNMVALPGRGKSHVIHELYKKYNNTVVVTNNTTLANNLAERIPETYSICSAIAKQRARERYIENVKQKIMPPPADSTRLNPLYFHECQLLVIDEAEDVNTKLLQKLYRVFPHVLAVVHAYDPEQILPIGSGTVALTLAEKLEDYPSNVILKKAFRFQSEQTNTNHNDQKLLKRELDQMVYGSLTLHNEPPPELKYEMIDQLESHMDLTFLIPPGGQALTNVNQFKHALNALNRTVTSFFTKSNMGDTICIVLTNKFRHAFNQFVDSKFFPGGQSYYKSQRITITKKNFVEKSLLRPDDEQKKKGSPSRGGRGGRGRGGGGRGGRGGAASSSKTATTTTTPKKKKKSDDDADRSSDSEENSTDEKKKTNAKEKPSTPELDPCTTSYGATNGKVFTISFIKDFDALQNKWLDPSMRDSCSTQDMRHYDFARLRRCIFTTCGKILCIHPDYIQSHCIEPAWAVSVDKAKGLEYTNVLFAFSSTADVCFSLNHLHVAITRAKQDTYILNTFDALKRLALSPDKQRYDTMAHQLETWLERFRTADGEISHILPGRLVPSKELMRYKTKSQPTIPKNRKRKKSTTSEGGDDDAGDDDEEPKKKKKKKTKTHKKKKTTAVTNEEWVEEK